MTKQITNLDWNTEKQKIFFMFYVKLIETGHYHSLFSRKRLHRIQGEQIFSDLCGIE